MTGMGLSSENEVLQKLMFHLQINLITIKMIHDIATIIKLPSKLDDSYLAN